MGYPHLPEKPLVVGISPPYTPYVYPCAMEMKTFNDSNCPLPGIDVEIFHYIMHYLNASYILKPLNKDAKWGMDGILGDLYNSSFDVIGVWYRITDDRLKMFEYSYPMPYESLRYGFLLQKAGYSMSLQHANVLHEVFPKDVWLYTGIVCLTLFLLHIITLNVVDWRKGKQFNSVQDISFRGMWSGLSITVDQYSGVSSFSTTSANLIFFLLGFTLLFMVSLYESSLVGALMKAPNLIPFIKMSQFADLVANGHYRVANDGGVGSVFFWNLVETSESETYRTLNQSLDGGKQQYLDTTVEGVLDALEENPDLVYPGQDYLNGGIYLVRGRCQLQFIMDWDAPSMTDVSFIFKKGNPWVKPIREALVSSMNVVQQIEAKYVEIELKKNRLECPTLNSREGDALKLRHYFGLIALCCMIWFVGFLVFVCEIGAKIRQKVKNRKAAKNIDELPIKTTNSYRQ